MKRKWYGVYMVILACMLVWNTLGVQAKGKSQKKEIRVVMSEDSQTGLTALSGAEKLKPGKLRIKVEDTDIVQVSKTGVIKARKAGKTRILCKSRKNNKTVAVVYVTVKRLKNIGLSTRKKLTIEYGDQIRVALQYKPSDMLVNTKWKSDNQKIVRVDAKGNVTARGLGKTRLVCTINGRWKRYCEITVVPVKIKKITTANKTVSLDRNQSVDLTKGLKVSPDDAKNQKLRYVSADPAIAKVNAKGRVKGIQAGETVITVSSTDGGKAVCKITVQVNANLLRSDVSYIAHRGYSCAAPENTVKAFTLAAQMGYDGIETDIYYTKDGQFVLSHDDSLLRMCGVDRKISDMTLEEVRQQKIINGNQIALYQDEVSATRVPTLQEYLEVCKQYGVRAFVEIKFLGDSAALTEDNMLYRLYRELAAYDQVTVMSFDLNQLKSLQQICKQCGNDTMRFQHLIALVTERYQKMIPEYAKLGMAVGVSYVNQADRIQKFVDAGVDVGVWTVDDIATGYRLWKLGVRYMTSNVKLWSD